MLHRPTLSRKTLRLYFTHRQWDVTRVDTEWQRIFDLEGDSRAYFFSELGARMAEWGGSTMGKASYFEHRYFSADAMDIWNQLLVARTIEPLNAGSSVLTL